MAEPTLTPDENGVMRLDLADADFTAPRPPAAVRSAADWLSGIALMTVGADLDGYDPTDYKRASYLEDLEDRRPDDV